MLRRYTGNRQAVFAHMQPLRDDGEIFRRIVSHVAVAMMDDLTYSKRAP